MTPTPNDLPVPTPLSPAAQAVIKKVQATLPDYMISDRTAGFFAAAALGAAAMQTLLTSFGRKGSTPNDYELGWNAAVAHLQNIATELETK
jgi:hypothetical protein